VKPQWFFVPLVSALLAACAAQHKEAAEPRTEEAAPAAARPLESPESPESRGGPTSSRKPELEYADLAHALRAFESARREVDDLAVSSRDEPSKRSEADAGSSGNAPTPDDEARSRGSSAPKASAPAAAAEQAPSRAPSAPAAPAHLPGSERCARICRALGSMERASRGICRIAGEGSEHCTGAKDEFARSQNRAASCVCSKE